MRDRRMQRCKTAVHMLYMYSKRTSAMLALRLPPDLEKRLDTLAKRTGRSKSFYAREAILTHIEDIEDAYLAKRRFDKGAEPIRLDELERETAANAKT